MLGVACDHNQACGASCRVNGPGRGRGGCQVPTIYGSCNAKVLQQTPCLLLAFVQAYQRQLLLEKIMDENEKTAQLLAQRQASQLAALCSAKRCLSVVAGHSATIHWLSYDRLPPSLHCIAWPAINQLCFDRAADGILPCAVDDFCMRFLFCLPCHCGLACVPLPPRL